MYSASGFVESREEDRTEGLGLPGVLGGDLGANTRPGSPSDESFSSGGRPHEWSVLPLAKISLILSCAVASEQGPDGQLIAQRPCFLNNLSKERTAT